MAGARELRGLLRLPEAPTTRLLLAFSVLATLWLFTQILLFGYGRDQGIYAMVAETMLRGGMPYRDAWDFKPPGIFFVYALTRLVFGSGQWAIRLVEVLGLASMVGAFCILSRRFFDDARAGIVGGLLAVLVHAELEFWHTAQPESFGGILLVWAVVLATYEPRAAPRPRRLELAALVGSGALYAGAGLLKPPLIGGIAVSAAFAVYRRRTRPLAPGEARGSWLGDLVVPPLVMGAGAAATLGACALWFVARGAWADLYETLFVFTPHYTRLGWEGYAFPGLYYYAFEEWSVGYSSINLVGLVAALSLLPLGAREREGIWHLAGIVLVQLFGIAMQRKFFPYHYGSTLLLGGLLAGLGAFKLWKRAVSVGAVGVAAFALGAYVSLLGRTSTRDTRTDFFERSRVRQAWLFGSRSAEAREKMYAELYSVADVNYGANAEVASLLRNRIAPDERVLIWGFEPVIYDWSGRRPASRYLYDVPQRVAWFRDTAQARMMADFDQHAPGAVVVEHHDVFPVVTGNTIDSADSLRDFPALAGRLRTEYTLASRIEDFDVYLRNSVPR